MKRERKRRTARDECVARVGSRKEGSSLHDFGQQESVTKQTPSLGDVTLLTNRREDDYLQLTAPNASCYWPWMDACSSTYNVEESEER